MKKITDVQVLGNYRLHIHFDDGVEGSVDLSHLAGKGIFKIWLDQNIFNEVRIGKTGDLCWGDQIDLCPDSLYLKLTGKNPEDLFPALKREPVHA